MKHQATCTQFTGIHQTVKYITEAIYHHFVVSSKGLTEDQGEQSDQGVERWMTWEADVGTSEVPSGEMDGAQVGGCEV